jgi:hypothetical protein
MLDPDIVDRVAHIATLYRRGVICPAEHWRMLADRIAGRDAKALLSALPPDLQGMLRDCYRERALSLQSLASGDALFQEIETWCQQSDA